jgi:resuscitation-promoting factor RpfB
MVFVPYPRTVIKLFSLLLLLIFVSCASQPTPAKPVAVVQFWLPGAGLTPPLSSTERLPSQLLAAAGIQMGDGDLLLRDGTGVALNTPLPEASFYLFQVKPAVSFSLMENGQTQKISSGAASLGRALWDAGVHVSAVDSLSYPITSAVKDDSGVVLRRASTLVVKSGEREISIRSAAATIGSVLAEAGLSLQSLDISIPAEDQPLPGNGIIKVLRVREGILLEQTVIPFERSLQGDDSLELDQRRVIEAGQAGLEVTRVRLRYEDGVEVQRVQEAKWEASLPKTEVLGYGMQVVPRTTQTPDGTISYWRAVSAYATSYYPCGFVNRCSYTTASGMKLEKGVVAVSLAWYRYMKGLRVYVPGYGIGVIGDNGGGIPGKYWIDLGYSNEDYVGWHSTVTVYFLTPVPDKILWILP